MTDKKEAMEFYADKDMMKHFSCTECDGVYIGSNSEHKPLCPNCQNTRMVPTDELLDSLLDFLRYA